MKVEPPILYEILKKTFLYKGTPEMDVATLDFQEDGVRVREISTDRTIAIAGFFRPSLFDNYKSIGKVTVDSGLVKVLNDYFKTDEKVEIRLVSSEHDEAKIELVGEREKYSRKLSERREDTYFEVTATEFGYVPSKLEVDRSYLIESGNLRGISSEYVVFKYGGDGLLMSSADELSEYVRKVDYIKTSGNGEGEVSFFTQKLYKVLTLLPGQIWLSFTGSNKPITVSQITDRYTVSYIIAPRVVV